MSEELTLRQESSDDWWEVEALYDLCFGPGRQALSSYRLREGVEPVAELCLVARLGDGSLAGAIRHWPVSVGGKRALLLGPVAVHPTHQGEGVGALLIREGIARARQMGEPRMMLVGDTPYYRRFGFSRLSGVRMPPPTNPERVLGIDLAAPGWSGVSGPVERWEG